MDLISLTDMNNQNVYVLGEKLTEEKLEVIKEPVIKTTANKIP